MNIVFFGSDNFAIAPLKALLSTAHKVVCVVTQPDRKKGRGLSLAGTPIKIVASDAGLKIYQPKKINDSEAIKFLKNLNPDLFIVIAYGQILSTELLAIPKIFAINVHASLLPKYRGAAPINWAIIKGEKTTGITIIKMTKEMDAGQIILQKTSNINGDDTSITLEDKLSKIAAEMLLDTLKSIEDGNYQLIAQDENSISFAPKLKKEDGLINWERRAADIYNLVRGCIGWPGAFTHYKGKLVKIYKAKVSSQVLGFSSSSAGGIISISKEGIVIATGEGNLAVEELQIEGKRRMGVEEFIAGHKICIGEKFYKK